ncbi:MAG: 2-C-methyl-D-erythritol 2,4-cyclodiphosphate synthase [Oscillospiraceae bacterium]|nr:2-C-methyl-D-erythritol 2,4-cyclodiphosphate synthase [Oscillospiraceae bacterium]
MLRIGHGYDVHKLVTGRKLILGGVDIPYEYGLDGHSDADVLVHAIMDSILGALALGDIGLHFPDNAPEYSGADSLRLLAAVIGLMNEHGYAVNNIDSTILCQKPKLRSYIDRMRNNIATVCGCGIDRISVKATTEEGLGFTGSGEGIAAHAVCTLVRVHLQNKI